MNRLAKSALLLFFVALCGAAFLVHHLARKSPPAPAARELYSVVNQQLSALRAEDFDSAYRHAAAGVRQKFSRPDFELMIRRDFSELTEAEHVEFGEVSAAGATAIVQVFLTAPDRSVRSFLYSFTPEPDGWKIYGVQPLGARPVRRLPGLRL
ncbi:MAG: DUF4864 domain-containing protein [Spartobacteria bacterium]